jgi:hypothetical protein
MAISLTKQQNLKNGIDSLKASISYNSEEKKYFWHVTQTLEIIQNVHSGRTTPYETRVEECVIIDAISGKIISHETYKIGIIP